MLSHLNLARLRGLLSLAFLFLVLPCAAGSTQGAEVVRIACVGDSITEGTANPDHERNSWPRILGRLLEAEAPGRFVVGNFGRSGATALRR